MTTYVVARTPDQPVTGGDICISTWGEFSWSVRYKGRHVFIEAPRSAAMEDLIPLAREALDLEPLR